MPGDPAAAMLGVMKDAPEADIARLCRGDKAAWDAFVDRYSSVIYAAVRRTFQVHVRLPDEEDAREAVQDVFLRLIKDDYRLIGSYDPSRAALATWLSVIARNTAVDCLRRRRKAPAPLDREAAQAAGPEPADPPDLEIPENLLSPRQRITLHLLFDREMDVPAVARILKVSAQTVRSTKHKALEKLRAFFGASGRG